MIKNRIGREEIEALARVIEGGQLSRYSYGRARKGECDLFEEEFASFFGKKHALLVNSGTNALVAALVGLGVGPGDEVIVPAYTYIATPGAVLAAGATPVIANIDESLTLDVEDVRRKIGPRTKAILPVHMNGLPCQIQALADLARERKLLLVEDACQAAGGTFRGKRLGTFGDAGCFSFNHYKIMTCGEGGALITDDRRVFDRAFIAHDMGTNFTEYLETLNEPIFLSHSMRASELSGAILRVQLKKLEGTLRELRERKAILEETVAGAGDFAFPLSHDRAGDCGVNLILRFPSREACLAAQWALGDEKIYSLPVAQFFRHLHSSWEPILAGRVSHHESSNPLKRDGLFRYNPQDLAPSDEVASRTLLYFISLGPNLQETRRIGEAIRRALSRFPS